MKLSNCFSRPLKLKQVVDRFSKVKSFDSSSTWNEACQFNVHNIINTSMHIRIKYVLEFSYTW